MPKCLLVRGARCRPRQYDTIGRLYSRYRRPDPRIAAQIEPALGDAGTVLDVGAGTGSYEPTDRGVVAVEPSAVMISQRAAGSAPAVRSVAESLAVRVGHASTRCSRSSRSTTGASQRVGLREMARVGRRVVVLHFDQQSTTGSGSFSDYLPESNSLPESPGPRPTPGRPRDRCDPDRDRPDPGRLHRRVQLGLLEAPGDVPGPEARACMSGLALLEDELVASRMELLRADLADGTWHRRHGHLLALDSVDGGIRLVIRD